MTHRPAAPAVAAPHATETSMPDLNAARICAMLHEKHDADPWLFFAELRNQTGHGYHDNPIRTIDAFALNVWSSKFAAIAYEIKVSRADFLNEIKDASKREPFVENSTQFYYVVPNGLIQPGEVPTECGLMYAQKSRLVIKKVAEQRRLTEMPLKMMCAILRRRAMPYEGQKLFKYAGRDLTKAEFEKLVDKRAHEIAPKVTWRQKRELEANYEKLYCQSNQHKLDVYSWLAKHAKELGIKSWHGVTPQDLDTWLSKQRCDKAESMPAELRDAIDKLVKVAQRTGAIKSQTPTTLFSEVRP